ncbi:MAG: proton-conducting transporter membrane subunit [Halobacteriales archaeon]
MQKTKEEPLEPLPEPSTEYRSRLPGRLTAVAWTLWLSSVAVTAYAAVTGARPSIPDVAVVDGLTLVGWFAVTTISAVVHSYSRRYMEGDARVEGFFLRLTAFTLAAMVFVAADHLALLATSWLAMGLAVAGLIGHDRESTAARTSARFARRRYLLGTAALVTALAVLWHATGSATAGGVADAVATAPRPLVVVAAAGLVLAASIQSALVPFQAWLLSSMTAPTPASAVMHAGFVNAGGILLARFAPVVTLEPAVMLAITAVGAASALLGKLTKSVQADVKRKLGCSTVGQMGFMLMQVGLGFFAAAVTHLVLHGFYKADLFLSSGTRMKRTTPDDGDAGETPALGAVATIATALAGGALFAVLTGKGTRLDAGLVLALLVVLTTFHASRDLVGRRGLPPAVRHLGVPAVALPAIAVYALVYRGVAAAMKGLPAVPSPVSLTPLHAALAAAFVVGYFAVEFDVQRRSDRVYARLRHISRPAAGTVFDRRGGGDD